MHGKTRTSAFAVLFAASFLTTVPTAHADLVTSGDESVLGGNQAATDLTAPVNACGNEINGINGIAVLGLGATSCAHSGVAIIRDPDVEEPSAGEEPPAEERLVDECANQRGASCGGDQPGTPEKPERPELPGKEDERETPAERTGDVPDLPDASSPTTPVLDERTGSGLPESAAPLLPVTGTETTTLMSAGIVAMVMGAIALYIGYSRRGRKDGPSL